MNNNEEIQKAIERLNDSIVLPHLSQRGKDLECVLSAAKQLADVQRENARMREALETVKHTLQVHNCSPDSILFKTIDSALSTQPTNAENRKDVK